MQILKVETSVENDAAARELAASVLEQRLAACIQCERIMSHYRWDGSIACEEEVRMSFKTTLAARAALLRFLEGKHAYEVPEIVAHVVDTSAAYGEWVHAEVAHDGI